MALHTRAVVFMPPVKEGGARLTAINHVNALHARSDVHSAYLMIATSWPYRSVVAGLISTGVTKLFYDSFGCMDAAIKTCFRDLKEDDKLLMHSHGMAADHLLTKATPVARTMAKEKMVKLCLAATMHGEVEQYLARYLKNRNDWEAATIFSYVPDMLRTRNVLFYVAHKNLGPYDHPYFSAIWRDSNAKAKSFKVTNGIREVGDNNQTFASIGLQEGWFTFIVASRADDACKGHVTVAEAIQSLNAGSRNAQLILLGDGTEVDKINCRISRGELRNIYCAGQVASAQEWMHLADCHVLATTCAEESLPVCISDALFKRLPTISCDIGDIKAMMEGAGVVLKLKNGHLDASELVQAMEEVMDARDLPTSNPESYSAMQSKCSDLYNRNHKLSTMISQYFQKYSFAVPDVSVHPVSETATRAYRHGNYLLIDTGIICFIEVKTCILVKRPTQFLVNY